MTKYILIFFSIGLTAQQNCECTFSYEAQLFEKEKINLLIKNKSNKKLRIPKIFKNSWIRPIDIQVFNEEKKTYENVNYFFDEASCIDVKKCLGEMQYLKKGMTKVYEIQNTIGRFHKLINPQKKYRYKLSFNTYLFTKCENFQTDWLYIERE